MNGYDLCLKLKQIRRKHSLSAVDQALYHELVLICNERRWEKMFSAKSIDLCAALNISGNTLSRSREKLVDAGLIRYRTCADKRVGCYYSLEGETLDSPAESPSKSERDTAGSLSTSLANFEGDRTDTPISREKTKNKERVARACDDPSLKIPFCSHRFVSVWEILRSTPKWKKKTNYGLQLSLDKLGAFDEAFAILLMESAIEGNWTGVVFPETKNYYQQWKNETNENHRRPIFCDKQQRLLDEYRAIQSGENQSPPDSEVLDF